MLPSTAIPHRTCDRPVKGEPLYGLRVFIGYKVIDGLVPSPTFGESGHGTSSQSELATHMFPLLSAALPTG